MAIDPRGLSFELWAAQTAQLLAKYGPVGQVPALARWRDWARDLFYLPDIAALGIPQPDQFKTWQQWATVMNAQIALLGI